MIQNSHEKSYYNSKGSRIDDKTFYSKICLIITKGIRVLKIKFDNQLFCKKSYLIFFLQ